MRPTSPAPLTGNRRVASAPLWRLSWHRLRRRPLQYLLLLLGVALGVAMMVSIDLANGSAQRAFTLATDAVAGRATHRLVAGPAGLDEAIYRRLKLVTGFDRAAPVVEGYARVSGGSDRPLRLVGVDLFAEPPFRSYFGGGGNASDLAAFLAEPNGVILSQQLAAEYGFAPGDSLAMSVAGRPYQARLVALLQPGDDASRQALRDVMFADIATAQEMLDMAGRLSYVDLIVSDEAELAQLRASLPPDVTIATAASQENAIRQMTAAFELNLSALSLLALVVGMFLIYNTVTFSVVQRRQTFGVLRCLGVTGDQLFWLILLESAILGLLGSVLGVALGLILGRGMVRLVSQTINDLYFVVSVQDVALPAATLVKGLLVGAAAACLASLLPALEARRTEPQSSLRRSTLEGRVRALLPWLLLAWAILTAAGALLLSWQSGGLIAAFAGLFIILIAAALLAPPLTAMLMAGLSPLTGRLAGVLGRLAPRDIARSLSRTSVAIAALMTAVSVVVGVSIMIGSFRQTVVQWLDQTLQADIYISPPGVTANLVQGTLAPEIVTQIRGWPGLEQVVTSRAVSVGAPALARPVRLVAVDGDVSGGQRPYAWRLDGADPWPGLEAGEGVIITEPLLRKANFDLPPPPITLDTPAGPRSFPVLAVAYDYASDQGAVLIDQVYYQRLWQDTAITSMALFVPAGEAAAGTVAALRQQFAGRQDLLIQSNQGLRQGSLAIFDRTFAITAALRLLAIVVAFIGILSALMSLQLEQSREIGVMRATGMSVRQMWQLTLLKTGLMGGTAGLLAMPVGFALAWILIYVINVRSFGWTLQMQLQPSYFVQALLVALLAALLAGIYPSWRAGQVVIATAVREE